MYFRLLPDKSTLIRWAYQIREETLNKINQRSTQIAKQKRITKETKVRTDGTVVASNIHYSSDNSLLTDSVKVIERTFKKGRRWRHGVEGRISSLKRCFGLERCLISKGFPKALLD